MRIAICDDNAVFVCDLEFLVDSFCIANNIEIELDTFFSGESFLASQQNYDIVFMDIYIGDMNGVRLVQDNEISKKSQVVFTTSSREFAIDAFNLNAAHYLIKPLVKEDVFAAMERALNNIEQINLEQSRSKVIEIKTGRIVTPVPESSIIYIESNNKLSVVVTESDAVETYMPLNSIVAMLDEKLFLRVQRSYIVNMNFIDSFTSDSLILSNGMEVSLSRKNRTEIKNQYQDFLFDLARKGAI